LRTRSTMLANLCSLSSVRLSDTSEQSFSNRASLWIDQDALDVPGLNTP